MYYGLLYLLVVRRLLATSVCYAKPIGFNVKHIIQFKSSRLEDVVVCFKQ